MPIFPGKGKEHCGFFVTQIDISIQTFSTIYFTLWQIHSAPLEVYHY